MTHRVTITKDVYPNYKIVIEYRKFILWRYLSQRIASNKFEALKIALKIAKRYGITPIDKTK